ESGKLAHAECALFVKETLRGRIFLPLLSERYQSIVGVRVHMTDLRNVPFLLEDVLIEKPRVSIFNGQFLYGHFGDVRWNVVGFMGVNTLYVTAVNKINEIVVADIATCQAVRLRHQVIN